MVAVFDQAREQGEHQGSKGEQGAALRDHQGSRGSKERGGGRESIVAPSTWANIALLDVVEVPA